MTIARESHNLAKELYIIEGLSFEQAAERTAIPIGTIKRWALAEGWSKRREEYQSDREDFRESLSELRDRMLTKALGSLDPQDIYPLVALEKLLTARIQAGEEDAASKVDQKMTPEELLQYIRENVYGLR